MLKVGIVGCGNIADWHASQIQRIKGCQIVGACDTELLMAQQLCDRFPIQRYCDDVKELLRDARPDVVHITTPPQSHFALAKSCLEAGTHVYVEKPFTLHAEEAEDLVALASRRELKLTVGHDDQFSHVARRMREIVASGYLGGPPIHMESHFGYDLTSSYARAVVYDQDHWVRRLPGKLLHNVISHGIARIAEFLTSDSPSVVAYAFPSSLLTGLGDTEIVDELRVIIGEEERTTAYFTFSSQMRPSLHQFSLYGPKNGLVLNQDHETLITLRGGRFTSYLEQVVPPVLLAQQHLANVARTVWALLTRDFHVKSGMRYLIESFYRSITNGTPLPIPYAEILRTARIMDSIFEQIRADRPQADAGFDSRPPALAGHTVRT